MSDIKLFEKEVQECYDILFKFIYNNLTSGLTRPQLVGKLNFIHDRYKDAVDAYESLSKAYDDLCNQLPHEAMVKAAEMTAEATPRKSWHITGLTEEYKEKDK